MTAVYGIIFVFCAVTAWASIYYILRIIIAVRIGWRGTSHLYKASTVIFAVIPISPLPEILFIVDRIQQKATQSIDITWTVFSVLLFYSGYLGLVPVLFLSSLATRKAWTRAYDEDWPASSNTWLHRLTFTFGMRMSRAVATERRALSGYYTASEANDSLFFTLGPILAVRILLKDPFGAFKMFLEWSMDLGKTGPFDQTTDGVWHARWCTFCSDRIESEYFHCALCKNIDIYKSYLQNDRRCEHNDHYLFRCNDSRTVDKKVG